MKYNKIYEVDPSFISGSSIMWVNTGNGEYVIGTKGGKRYFIKRNMHVRHPSDDLPDAVNEIYRPAAEAIEHKQEKLRSLMKGLDWTKCHIVAEEENFWDDEKMFVTVTPCVPDVLPEDFDYSALTFEEFLQLALNAAQTLALLHSRGVIHGDLKPKNILVAKKRREYVPYLIDFDSSYPADEVPERDPESGEAGGSAGYQSPELIAYGGGLCEKDKIGYGTDVFSLGVVFHKWWAGAFPGIDMERGSVGHAVYYDKEVTIHKKFNVRIGKNCGATLTSLINWMFAKDLAERPTAEQVAAVLADKSEVPEKFHKGDDVKPFDTALWDEHKLVAELLPADDLRALGLKSLKRINEGGGAKGLKYRVVTKDDAEKTLTITEICGAGYAKGKSAELEEPWEGHMIEFEPADDITKKGYVKIKKAKIAFRKRYIITTASGMEIDKGCEWLISEGLAHYKKVEIESDTPWPEHGTAYDAENMARLNVKSISRMEVGGEHRYKIVYNEIIDGKNKVNEKVPVNNLKLMGFIK